MIFINYRKTDSQAVVDHLAKELKRHFGNANVFKDDQDIVGGQRWPDRLRQELLGRKILLAIIGPNWLTVLDEYNRRRIDDEDDWVRREICTALEHRKEVIVLLVGPAKLPDKRGLPQNCPLQEIPDIQHLPLRHGRDWDTDLAALISRLKTLLPPEFAVSPDLDQPPWQRNSEPIPTRPLPQLADLQPSGKRENESLVHEGRTLAGIPEETSTIKKLAEDELRKADRQEKKGDHDGALFSLDIARTIYDGLDDRAGVTKVLVKMITILRNKGDTDGERKARKELETVLRGGAAPATQLPELAKSGKARENFWRPDYQQTGQTRSVADHLPARPEVSATRGKEALRDVASFSESRQLSFSITGIYQ